MAVKTYTRREIINSAIKAVATALLFPLFIAMSKKAKGESPEGEGKEPLSVTLSLEEEKYAVLREIGGSVYVSIDGEGKPVIVHRVSEKEVSAFSSSCSHAGCKVRLPENGKVICPCHSSVFDAHGKQLKGPASRDLKQFSAKLQDSTIVVTSS